MTTSETGHATQPASSGETSDGMTSRMAAMFDRLRDAAAEHDGECDLLPRLQVGSATGQQPSR